MATDNSREIFAKNLAHYMEITGTTRNDLCKALDLKYTTVRDWLKGLSYPRPKKIMLLADYFGIEKVYLTEEHSDLKKIIIKPDEGFIKAMAESLPKHPAPSPADLILLGILENATDDQKMKILSYAKYIVESEAETP